MMICSGPCAAFSASVLSADVAVAGGLMPAGGARGKAERNALERSAGGLTTGRLSGCDSCRRIEKNALEGMVEPPSSSRAAPAVAVLTNVLCVKIMAAPSLVRNDPRNYRAQPLVGPPQKRFKRREAKRAE